MWNEYDTLIEIQGWVGVGVYSYRDHGFVLAKELFRRLGGADGSVDQYQPLLTSLG